MSPQPGDRIRVIGGPYTGWTGEVLRTGADGQRVIVVIAVFAKPTAIDLDPSEISRVTG
jgi:transcription antitermination factor NusG